MSEATPGTVRGWSDDLRWALHASGPVAMGYVPLGMALGALVVNLGLHWWLAPVMATVVYAGSMEFLLAGLLVSAPGLASVALATLAVNFRHIFYPLAYPTRLLRRPWQKVLGAWQLTDEMYALLAGGMTPQSSRQVLTLSSVTQFWWVSGTVLGTAIGSLVPAAFKGLDFAMTGLFIALALNFFLSSRTWRVAGYAAVGIGASLLLPGPFLAWSLSVFTLCCLAEVRVADRRGRGAGGRTAADQGTGSGGAGPSGSATAGQDTTGEEPR
ncbi:AzlC family ABC transporter permease [Acidipropionibacterium virtanenii]|uniref:Inner membrane protein YgaZ n=1 Tax=Acidipropionibacterium virtanenii TaxID=2057246 RepID=A0A344UQU0_9ACTN|nr:AzlC family ABC transporter permease [Acidipropionibacterium virtanenii]AXE37638.1 Inner membrane protein YgaZ [Acidipropionibacterium virtanenii]